MIKYSTLYGTAQSGDYGRQGNSRMLREFLERQMGGGSIDAVVEAMELFTRPMKFDIHPGYEKERLDNKPVAIRYVPMHLYRLENMPKTMKPFCALGVTGLELRKDTMRTIWYTHTHVFPEEYIRKSGKYNYLDHLFGIRITTWADVKAHRENRQKLQFDSVPQKVYPMIREDREWVLKTLNALYRDKRVVLCLEEGTQFNQRARDLLMQIYSLLPPLRALETGFATYQRVEEIEALEKTNIQLYVVPAGVKVEGLSRARYEILDLGSGEVSPAEDNELTQTMRRWMAVEWSERQPMMEAVFAKKESVSDAKNFVETSRQYFQARKEFDEWAKRNAKQLKSLEDFALAFRDVQKLLPALPDWRELLKAAVPGMLADGMKVEQLNVKAVADLFFEQDSSAKKNQYNFAMALGGVDHNTLSGEVARRQKVLDDVALDAERQAHAEDNKKSAEAMTAAAAAHALEMDNAQKAHGAEIDRLNTEHSEKLTAEQNAHAADNEKYEKQMEEAAAARAEDNRKNAEAMAAAAAAHALELDNAKQEHFEQMEKLNADHAQTISDMEAQTRALFQKQTDEHNQAMAAAAEAHEKALAGEQSKTNEANTRADQEKSRADGLQDELTQLSGEMTAVKQRLTKANSDLTTVRIERDNAEDALKTKEDQLAAVTSERNSVVNILNNAKANGGILPEDAQIPTFYTDEGQTGGRSRSGGKGGRFSSGKQDMKMLFIAAVAGLAVGLLLMGLIWGIVSAVYGGAEETLPVETTLPIETTLPVETTVPPETTLPPETTVPTEPPTVPTEPALDQIDWDEAMTVSGMSAYTDDENTIANLLYDYTLSDDARILGILTDEQDGFGEIGTTLPETFAVLMLKEEAEEGQIAAISLKEPEETAPAETGETAPEETAEPAEPVANDLEQLVLAEEAAMIIEGDHYRLVIVGEGSVQSAGLELFRYLNPEEDVQVRLTAKTPAGEVMDLTELLEQSLDAQDWWNLVDELSFDQMDCTYGQSVLSSKRVPVAAVFCGEEYVFVYDYRDDADSAVTMLEIQQGKGRGCALVEGYVAVHYVKEAPAETTPATETTQTPEA